jgi:hypothetical protein
MNLLILLCLIQESFKNKAADTDENFILTSLHM